MIKVENLSKEFKKAIKEPGILGMTKSLFIKKYETKKAVDNISFTINKGEIVGYIGANGAGKSTSIKMMTGILTPSSGHVTVNGLVPYEDRVKNAKNIGVVFGQKTQLWWNLPLIETYNILKQIYDITDEDFKEKMDFFEEVLSLSEFIKSPVRTLSLGQRMRADLAASLLHNPKVLYLDEPTIGLDVVVKEKIRAAIKHINQKYDTTILLTTHDMTDIEDLCSRIIVIDDGKILYDGKIEEIRKVFGDVRTLTIEVKDSSELDSFDPTLIFDEDNVKHSKNENKLTLQFDNDVISFEDVLNSVFKSLHVIDMKHDVISIEDIAKKIYQGGF